MDIVTNTSVSDFLGGLSSHTFKWGTFDCADFFVLCMEFLTGFDYSPIISGKWGNKKQALKFFAKLTFVEFIDEEVEFTEQTIYSCKTGDLCVFYCGKMHTVGMIYDTTVACVIENLGLVYEDLAEIEHDIVKIIRVHNG